MVALSPRSRPLYKAAQANYSLNNVHLTSDSTILFVVGSIELVVLDLKYYGATTVKPPQMGFPGVIVISFFLKLNVEGCFMICFVILIFRLYTFILVFEVI
jgi:hypothetical protein